MINKKKNVMIQVTFPKQDAEQLETLNKAFNGEGIKTTKSQILVHALREYIKALVYASKVNEKQKKTSGRTTKENKINA